MNYIFKDNNEMSQFYFKGNDIIKKDFIDGSWKKEKILLENRKSNFTATRFKNKIYIFSQSVRGDIILSIIDGNKSSEQTILKNTGNTSKTYKIYFYPLISQDNITLIYNAFMDNSHYLLMQVMSEKGKWEQPIKLDIIKPFKSQVIYFEQINEAHGLIFYQKKDKSNTKLGFREITINNYGEFKSFYTTAYPIIDITTLSISKGIFVAYIVKGIFSHQLVFMKKQRDFNNPIVIADSQTIEKPLLFLNNGLHLFYTMGSNIYHTYSNDLGDTFSTPEKYKKENGNELIKSFYNDGNPDIYVSNEIYISKDRELKVIPDFCNNFMKKISDREIENTVNDQEEFNSLKDKIAILQNKLRESQKSLEYKDRQIISLTKSLHEKSNEMNFLINDFHHFKHGYTSTGSSKEETPVNETYTDTPFNQDVIDEDI